MSEPASFFIESRVVPYYKLNPLEVPIPVLSKTEDLSNGKQGKEYKPFMTSDQLFSKLTRKLKIDDDLGFSVLKSIFVPSRWKVRASNSSTSIDYVESGYVSLVGSDWTTLQFYSLETWESIKLKTCTGQMQYRWGNAIFAYLLPHQDSCDTLMTQLCADQQALTSNPACACFLAKSQLSTTNQGEDVLVTCLNGECAENGYKTKAMVTEECSLNYCDNIVINPNTNKMNVTNSGKTNIYCDGRIWTPGSNDVPSDNVPGTPGQVTKSIPTLTWVILGFSTAVAIVLVLIMVVAYS